MHPHAIEALGFISGIILNSSAIPQIYKCYQTKSTRDLSWITFGVFFTGMSFNMIYGIMIHHPAVYIGATGAIIINGTLACMKYYYENIVPSTNVTTTDNILLIERPLSDELGLRTKI